MTMTVARRPYTAPKVGATYNATEIRQALALLAQAISPMSTRSVVATGATVLSTDDLIIADTTSGSFAIILPPASQVQFLRFSVINIGTHTLTLTGTVSGTVNPTYAQWKSAIIQTDGTAYYKLGGV